MKVNYNKDVALKKQLSICSSDWGITYLYCCDISALTNKYHSSFIENVFSTTKEASIIYGEDRIYLSGLSINLSSMNFVAKKTHKRKTKKLKEEDRFKKIKSAVDAKRLLELGYDSKYFKVVIEYNMPLIEELMKIFNNYARYLARNWINNDRLNDIKDWEQIVEYALFQAIMTYDLSYNAQFTTHLKTKIREYCKDEKHKSSIVSTNASAVHKWREINKVKMILISEGKDPCDIFLLAKGLNRKLITPLQVKRFEETLIDMGNIFPFIISMDFKINESSRTIGETIEAPDLNPNEAYIVRSIKNEFKQFCTSLDDMSLKYIKIILGILPKERIEKRKIIKRIQDSNLKQLLFEMNKYSYTNIDFYDFLR